MDRIRILPDGVANQIAAGEVVVRPASVVKELMENAVDAGSKSVTVNFRDGGRELIQVVDDGSGMSANDARLAFERHATSKIKTADDLYLLTSFGFRGEALPSIASVAEVEVKTKTAETELGVQLRINGGKFEGQTEVQIAQGTQFLVRNLFYNVPARKRFLKEAPVEARHIITEFQRVALCNPAIAFSLYNDHSPVFNLPSANLRQRIVGVMGKQIAGNLLEVSVDTSMIRIEGFVGRPSAARKTNREQFLFVNGRYFRCAYFHKAVLQAYEKLIPSDTQPAYFLYFTIAPERIDVNIHPTKTEIRFDDEKALWQIINAAVRESLGRTGVVPMMDFEMDSSFNIPVYKEGTPYRMPEIGINPEFNPFDEGSSPRNGPEVSGGSTAYARSWNFGMGGGRNESALISDRSRPYETSAGRTLSPGEDFNEMDSSLREFILGEESAEESQGVLDIESGTVFGGVLPLAGRHFATTFGGSLAVVDIHRAFERIRYERYLRMLGNNHSVSQQLLFPERIALPAGDYAMLTEYRDDLQAVGFDFTLQPGHEAEITGIPGDIPAATAGAAFLELIARIGEMGGIDPGQRLTRLAAVMARTGGASRDALNEQEMEQLLDELMSCDNFNYTPSGNPVITVITGAEIAKRLNSRAYID